MNLMLVCGAETVPNGKTVLALNIVAASLALLFFLYRTAIEIAKCTGLQREVETPKSLDLTDLVSGQPLYVPENTEIRKLSICGSVGLLELANQIVEKAVAEGLQEIEDRQRQEKTSPDRAPTSTPFPTAPENPVISNVLQEPPGKTTAAANLNDYVLNDAAANVISRTVRATK
ncbi:hypothetical protein [Neorickettsia sp. 179522]|uniref:hypothetical protein n=1 Tax=Neorickettsia sp. 179522 TaxID=1714371 RepID=UPI001E446D6E|nr:hypothetical protein [Neorickettsia sp. 179522]